MSKFAITIAALVLLILVGGAVFLATWNIPPPSAPVEKVISNERLPK